MATSGTYNFSSIQVDDIITDSYERCGINPSLSSGEQGSSALRSLNLMFLQWVATAGTTAPLLWTVEQCMLDLVRGQSTYQLPSGTYDIAGNELTVAVQTRVLNGTPFASAPTLIPTPGAGGVAANAFDSSLATACTQTAVNGNIGYDFGSTAKVTIQYVGINSYVNATYNIVIEYSFDNVTYYPVLTTGDQTYVALQTKWYIPVAPVEARYLRIREASDPSLNRMLNIAELYFHVANSSYRLSRISRMDYISIPNKDQQSTQSSFIVLRNINPSLILWPVPDGSYPYLVYNRIRYIQDVNDLQQTLDIPPSFIEPATAGLAARLALKFAPDRSDSLKMEFLETFKNALDSDAEAVPIRFQMTNYKT